MILDELYGSVIYEQTPLPQGQVQPQPQGQVQQSQPQPQKQSSEDPNLDQFHPEEDQLDGQHQEELPSDPPEFMPLKKYMLLDKLRSLKNNLDLKNINNSDLETLLKFGNSLSYDTLILLSNGIVESISKQFKGKINEKKNAI